MVAGECMLTGGESETVEFDDAGFSPRYCIIPPELLEHGKHGRRSLSGWLAKDRPEKGSSQPVMLALHLPNISEAPGDGSGEVADHGALSGRGARTSVQGEGSREGHGFFADLKGGKQSARGGGEGGAECAGENVFPELGFLGLKGGN